MTVLAALGHKGTCGNETVTNAGLHNLVTIKVGCELAHWRHGTLLIPEHSGALDCCVHVDRLTNLSLIIRNIFYLGI